MPNNKYVPDFEFPHINDIVVNGEWFYDVETLGDSIVFTQKPKVFKINYSPDHDDVIFEIGKTYIFPYFPNRFHDLELTCVKSKQRLTRDNHTHIAWFKEF